MGQESQSDMCSLDSQSKLKKKIGGVDIIKNPDLKYWFDL